MSLDQVWVQQCLALNTTYMILGQECWDCEYLYWWDHGWSLRSRWWWWWTPPISCAYRWNWQCGCGSAAPFHLHWPSVDTGPDVQHTACGACGAERVPWRTRRPSQTEPSPPARMWSHGQPSPTLGGKRVIKHLQRTDWRFQTFNNYGNNYDFGSFNPFHS